MEGDGGLPTLEGVNKQEPIGRTDAYGDTTIDTIYKGGDWFASMTCMEYKAGPIAALWPFGTLGLMGVIGRLGYGISTALVLTAIAGTPAASSPASLTATRAILAPGFNTRLLFGPKLRTVPLRFQLLPYLVGGTSPGWFSTT